MKNAMQLKAMIKSLAKEKNISAQLVMQNFMLKCLLERVSAPEYKENLILKGGFLIAAVVGPDSRATMDMDATVKGIPVNENNVKNMLEELCQIDLEDNAQFLFCRIVEIRENNGYIGYRVPLAANYPPMTVPLKLDITTEDRITPKKIEYKFRLMLEDRDISVLAYDLETVLAEKLETVVTRGNQNTGPRDYYDIYVLKKLQYTNIRTKELGTALSATAEKRGSIRIMAEYEIIMNRVKNSEVMQGQWRNYQKDFDYVVDIDFAECCDNVAEVMRELEREAV